jgi:hypothetical protein
VYGKKKAAKAKPKDRISPIGKAEGRDTQVRCKWKSRISSLVP